MLSPEDYRGFNRFLGIFNVNHLFDYASVLNYLYIEDECPLVRMKTTHISHKNG